MPEPTLALEFAPGDVWNEASPTWVDITADLRSVWSMMRGRSNVVDRIRPGSMRFTLRSTARAYDPEYAAGTYYGDLVPLTLVRLRATHNTVTYPVFCGYIMDWPNSILRHSKLEVDVEAVDGLTVLQQLKIPDSYETAVLALSPLGYWKLDEASGTTATDYGSAGVDGTYTNTPTLDQTGPMDNMPSVKFERGSSEHVDVGSLTGSNTATTWTVMGWAKPDAADTAALQSLVSFDNSAGNDRLAVYLNPGAVGGAGTLGNYGFGIRLPRDDGTTLQQNVAVLSNAFYHWAVTADATTSTVKVYISGALVATYTDWDSTVVAGAMNVTIGKGRAALTYADHHISQVAIWGSVLTAAQIASLAGKTFNGFDSQLTSARITAALDLIEWPAALRDLDTGLSTMVAFDGGITALDAILAAAETENGQVWVAPDGKLTFRNREARSTSTPAATFSDDGADVKHHDASWTVDDLNLFNRAQVTGAGGDVIEYSDTTGVTRYGPRVITRTSETSDSDEVQDYARWLVQQYATPRTRFRFLKALCYPGSSNTRWAAMLGVDLGDLLNVEITPPGGGAAIDLDEFIEQIELRVDTGRWEATYQLSPADGQRFFTLDDSTLGVLDGAHEGGLAW